MDYLKDNTESRKQKRLNFEERITIQIRLLDGYSPYRIAKELGKARNTILNEIRRGTTSQIKVNKKVVIYLADTGNAVYKKNRSFCCPRYKRLICDQFIRYVCKKVKVNNWSLDACVGNSKLHELFPITSMVCIKTLYNYVDLGLMELKNIDLPMKLRRSTKPTRILKNRRKLGTSITQRPESIEQRTEFGHWEIDTVIGHKTKEDSVLLTNA